MPGKMKIRYTYTQKSLKDPTDVHPLTRLAHSSLVRMCTRLHTPYFILFLFFTTAFAFPGQPWKELPPKKFHAQIQAHPEAMILDTRMVEKYERNRIPGAQPAPYTEALKALTDTLAKDHRLLVYCGHDDRSTHVARMLNKEMGFKNVFRLKGGLIKWEKENLPLDTTAVRTGLE